MEKEEIYIKQILRLLILINELTKALLIARQEKYREL